MNVGHILQLYQSYFEDVTKGWIIFSYDCCNKLPQTWQFKTESHKSEIGGLGLKPRCHQNWACRGGSGEGSLLTSCRFWCCDMLGFVVPSPQPLLVSVPVVSSTSWWGTRRVCRAHPAKLILKSFLVIISAQTPFPCEVTVIGSRA